MNVISDWSVDDDRLLAVFTESATPSEPRTAAAVAAAVAADKRAIEDRLRTLVDDGELQTTVVSGTRVWWRPPATVGLHDTTRDQRLALTISDSLNHLFREITTAVFTQSTRSAIEQTLCSRLADSEFYTAAWLGEVELSSEEITSRAQAGVQEFKPTSDPEADPVAQLAAHTAVNANEPTVADDSCCHHLGDDINRCVAIPLVHESTQYGVVGVGTDRPAAYGRDERAVLGELGMVAGHAIAASERQRALLNNERVELSFLVEDLFAHFDSVDPVDGRISYDRSVPIGDGGFLVYGTASGESFRSIKTLVDDGTVDRWESVTILDSSGDATRFELTFSDHPVLSTVTALGGRIHEATVEDGTLYIALRFAPNTDIQGAIDTIKTTYPGARLVKRSQAVSSDRSSDRFLEALSDRLTDRQSAALEAAYGAGFFNWPRDSSGEAVADSLGISPATFHQHLRKAQATLLELVFEHESTDR